MRVQPVSWLISRIARIGFSRERSRITVLPSTMRSTRSVIPTFMNVVHSLMLESPTMTWSRRKRSASACGSSRVLMMGRDRVVALETPSQMCSARWLMQNCAPRGPCSTLPAPHQIWRVTKNGIKTSAMRANSPWRATR